MGEKTDCGPVKIKCGLMKKIAGIRVSKIGGPVHQKKGLGKGFWTGSDKVPV